MVKTTTDTKTAKGLYLDYVKELIRDLKNSKDWKLTNKPTDPNNKFEFFTGTEEALIINSTDRTIRWVKQGFVKGLVHRVKNSMMVSGFIYFWDHPLTNQERKQFTFNDLIDLTIKSLSKDILEVDEKQTGFYHQLQFFDDGNFSRMIELVVLDENKKINDSDDQLLKIIKDYLLSEESTEYLLKEKEPGYLCSLLSSVSKMSDKKSFSAVDKILEFFPRDVLLESLIYRSKSQDPFYSELLRTSYCGKRLYEFLFVESNVDNVDDLKSLKLMFTKFFFIDQYKGKDRTVKYHRINPSLFSFLVKFLNTNLKDSENLKVFEDLRFCFEKALTFLDELEQDPILNIVSREHEVSGVYYFDLSVVPNNHLEEVNLLKQFLVKPLQHAKETTNIRFVFSQDSPELSLFFNSKYFESTLRHWVYNPGSRYREDFEDFSELLKVLEELFKSFSEVIKEKDRSELELLMLDLQRWKGKLVFFEKIKNNQIECFVS